MTSKEKLYNDKRRALMRNCILILLAFLMDLQKKDLKLIDLSFLKSTEHELKRYQELLFPSSNIPRKLGETEQ